MSFYENLLKLQAERGESSYRLAKELGVSQTTIANWRSGRNKPLGVYAERAAAHFGVTVEALLGEAEDTK